MSLSAQQRNYFQQAVDYHIQVRLDDQTHFLHGKWSIHYRNNSPDTLHFIYLHLYPNAYKNHRTALAQQMLENGKTSWYFAPKEERGYIDSLKFKTDTASLKWELDSTHIDIAKIYLAQPLAPNQSVQISSPMRVKIPKTVSRLGHVGESYQMTQWYPKPAVYDADGWHPMPYLDQGEFYSEFGSFDVSITLPENYVVAATGELQTEAERAWLDEGAKWSEKQNFTELAKLPDTFPASSEKFKTIRYTAQQVHDFAWFADKRFYILKDSVRLTTGKEVKTWVFFTKQEANLWQGARLYVNRSVRFYSEVVGEYPYPHATAVQSALSAGGGMEYPMITVIGLSGNAESLDNVITHEVGHNWFYGILGSNERQHAWMDEGWNSYVESRYMEKYYNKKERLPQLAYLYQSRRGVEQPIETPSQDATQINYYLGAYVKPMMVFRHLERYLGTEKMDKVLHEYFNQWKFKHPQPSDLQRVFEQQTGENLDWLFKDWIGTNKLVDYSIKKYKFDKTNKTATITVQNEGETSIAINVAALSKSGKTLAIQWFNFAGKDTTIQLTNVPDSVASFEIDAFENIPDYQPNNNVVGNHAKNKLGVRLIADFKYPEKRRINLLPVLGYNQYDGFYLGLAAYNLPIPTRKFQYTIAPVYAFGSKTPIGFGEFQYNYFPTNNKPFERLTAGLTFRTFHDDKRQNTISFFNVVDSTTTAVDSFQYRTQYFKFTPYLEIELPKNAARATLTQTIRLENSIFINQVPQFEKVIVFPDSTTTRSYSGNALSARSTHRLSYIIDQKRKLAPFTIISTLEYANYKDFGQTQHYLKLTAEGRFRFLYNGFSGGDIRVFMGGFIANTDRQFGAFPLNMASRNQNDYQYDNLWIARNEQSNFASQQISLQDGAFKTPIPQSTADGHSNTFLMAVNFKTDIPIKFSFGQSWLKLKPYFDVGFHVNTEPSVVISSPSQLFMYNGGFMIDILNGAAGFYVPLFGSKDLMNQLKGLGGFGHRLSFSVNTKLINPSKILRSIEF